MKNHTKYPALITSILLSVAFFAAPAHADAEPLQRESFSVQSVISVPSNISITHQRTSVTTTPAPTPEPEPVVQVEEETTAVLAVPQTYTKTNTITAPAPKVEAAPVASASGKGASIAAAAYAQLGVSQDCTMLVTNSLAAVGINYHGWPAGYLSLGRTVSASEAQPGDLAYYANGGSGMAHIAVYVGGGKAVHGGWNGGTTSLQSVNVGSGPVFIRVA